MRWPGWVTHARTVLGSVSGVSYRSRKWGRNEGLAPLPPVGSESAGRTPASHTKGSSPR